MLQVGPIPPCNMGKEVKAMLLADYCYMRLLSLQLRTSGQSSTELEFSDSDTLV